MADLGYPNAVVHASDAAFQADIAAVRKAGLNIKDVDEGRWKTGVVHRGLPRSIWKTSPTTPNA